MQTRPDAVCVERWVSFGGEVVVVSWATTYQVENGGECVVGLVVGSHAVEDGGVCVVGLAVKGSRPVDDDGVCAVQGSVLPLVGGDVQLVVLVKLDRLVLLLMMMLMIFLARRHEELEIVGRRSSRDAPVREGGVESNETLVDASHCDGV